MDGIAIHENWTGEKELLEPILKPDSILQSITQMKKLFDTWLDGQMKSYQAEKSEHWKALEEHQQVINQLGAAEKEFQEAENMLSKKISDQQAELEKHAQLLDKLKLESTILPAQVDSLRLEMESHQLSLAQSQAEFEARKEKYRYRVRELDQGVDFYKQRLGLEFQRS